MRLLAQSAARPWRTFAGLLLIVTACSSDATAPKAPDPTTATITVDASSATAFVKLGTSLQLVTGADTTSTAWDISVNATTATLNLAAAVTGYCVCEHENDSDVAIMALTDGQGLVDFNAVTAASIPASTAFQADVFAVHPWYRYNLTGNDHQIWPTFNDYLIRRGSAVYKVQLTGYYDVSGAPRHVTLRASQLQQ